MALACDQLLAANDVLTRECVVQETPAAQRNCVVDSLLIFGDRHRCL